MTPDQIKEQKRAAADAAKTKATEARTAADASPDDVALKTAAETAEAEATRLEADAQAPSHTTRSEHSKSEKIQKRIEILREHRKAALIAEGKDPDDGATDEDLLDDSDDDIDPDKPLTMRDLQKIESNKSKQTAKQKAEAIQNPELRTAVLRELATGVRPSGDSDADYARAVAIVSASKNERIAKEAMRIGARTVQTHGSGGGAPANQSDAEFTATPLEDMYMKKFKLTKQDILDGRKAMTTLMPKQ